ncbi:MAG: PAS domain-containing protein [Elusimicrobia bacterium]|nr:PAS domain-containing protein [Elusimicrobiota bacterium]
MADAARTPYDAQALEVLKALGKTLSQINLYSTAHPAVKKLLGETAALLAGLLAESPEGELVYILDADKIIANGRVVGTAAQLPNSIPQSFARFKLHSVILKTGVSQEDLAVFCELASMRPEQARGVQASEFLAAKGVTRIALNEAIYAKVEKAEDAQPVVQPGAGAGGTGVLADAASAARGEAVQRLVETVPGQPIESTISELVRMAVPEPAEQARLMEAVLRRVREDLDRKVLEATTELRRQKLTVENEAARTQGVIETMAEGVVVVDEQGKVLTMNPEAENVLGNKLVEMAGKPVSDSAKDEHMLAMAKELVVNGERPVDKATDVKGTDETKRALRASTVVIQNEAGKTVGMVSAVTDKAKQRELDRMEREFVAHVTHELRAPLTSIRAALEIIDGMLAGKLPDEAGRMFQNALRNTDRLETLITSILDFSKLESGQMTVLPERAVAAKVASEAVESMKPWAQKKGLKLDMIDKAGGSDVSADVPRTVQVLVNLLSNAIKFTPKGGSITVSLSPAPDPVVPSVLYSIKDSGPGIPKDQQEKVFEKFVQIASGEKHVGGTGLGLAIAKALVHLQNGKMWIESEPGRGSDFRFTLPIFKAPVEEASRVIAPPPKSWWQKLLGL